MEIPQLKSTDVIIMETILEPMTKLQAFRYGINLTNAYYQAQLKKSNEK